MSASFLRRPFLQLPLASFAFLALISGNAWSSEAPGGERPHVGVTSVPASIGASGPLIDCDGAVKLKLGYKGAEGELVFEGTDCPTFVQIIPAHDKQIHKAGYRITSTVMVPRIDLYFKCDEGLFDDDCVFDRKEDGIPPVQHSYEEPCPWN